LSVCVRRGRFIVGTCSAMSVYSRDMSGVVGIQSGLVGKFGLVSVRILRGLLSVGTCSSKLGWCRYVFGEVCLVSGLIRGSQVSVGTCLAKSA